MPSLCIVQPDGRRLGLMARVGTKPTVPFVAKYKTIAEEVLRRRKAGEFFEQIALGMKASVRTIRVAHAFAMQTQADQPTPKPKPSQR